MENITYITGHKNPDTDSICSVIAYAEYKRKLGIKAVPVRLGDINRETEYVLKYFQVEPPQYLETVRTQVCDLDMDVINPASPGISIKTAWNIMKKNNVKVIPVVDESERLLGVVTLSDITERYMDTLQTTILATSKTPLANIVETLNARLLCGSQEDFHISGKVVVAASEVNQLASHIEKDDIVIVGGNTEVQRRLLELGANCVIVTCGGRVEEEILTLAQEQHAIMMLTLGDTFTTARMINQSIPIGYTMTPEVISFNTDDYVDDIREKMLQTRFRSYPVVDSNYRIRGFISRYHLISKPRKKIILLDHNEEAQTVDGIDQAEILEIIDHHRVGDIQTGNPISVRNEPVGSTSTIIANIYFDNGIAPSRPIAGILCAAILSDTLKFKSPTCTFLDRSTAEKLAAIAGIHMEEFALSMFRAGSSLKGKTPEQILFQDFKDFGLGKYRIGIGQITTMDREGMDEIKGELLKYMEEVCGRNNYNLMMLLVTDILRGGSEMFFTGKDRVLLQKAFNVNPGDNSAYFEGLISRKKQIIPQLAIAAAEQV